MLLKDRRAIVSGVGPGTGRELALALAREGADVALACRKQDVAQEIAREVEGLGRRALPLAMDVTQPEDREGLVDATVSTFGGIDVLVNNAFAMGHVAPVRSAVLPRAWKAAFEVNVFGTVALCQLVAPVMEQAGGGSIVMINSLAARQHTDGMAGYGASKAALLSAARSLASELGPAGIRVNTVVPSHIDGPNLRIGFRLEAQRRGITEDEVYRETTALGVLDHVATSEEVAQVAVFFASDRASAVTGQTLDVSCGQWFG